MALRTTSLVVRTAALGMLSGVVHRLDRDAADKMMDVCLQVGAGGGGEMVEVMAAEG
jgi:hypothetical protein